MTDPFNADVVVFDTSVLPSPEIITVQVPGMQGPSMLWVGPTNELTPGRPGIWIQTGLEPNGEGYTMWIQDGE